MPVPVINSCSDSRGPEGAGAHMGMAVANVCRAPIVVNLLPGPSMALAIHELLPVALCANACCLFDCAVPPARCVTKRRSIDESCRTSLAHGDPAKAHSGKSSTQAAADYTVLKRAKQMHDDSPRSLPSSFSGILQPFSIVKVSNKQHTHTPAAN